MIEMRLARGVGTIDRVSRLARTRECGKQIDIRQDREVEDAAHGAADDLRIVEVDALVSDEHTLHTEPIRTADDRTEISGIGHAIQCDEEGIRITPDDDLSQFPMLLAEFREDTLRRDRIGHALHIAGGKPVDVRGPLLGACDEFGNGRVHRRGLREVEALHGRMGSEGFTDEPHALNEERSSFFAFLLAVQVPHVSYLRFGNGHVLSPACRVT